MAQTIGVRDTRQSITQEGVLIRQVDDQLVLLEPNETPLVTFMMSLKKRKAVKSPRYEWLEDDFVARWAQVSATTAVVTADTTINVVDGTLFVAGDLFVVPNAVSSSTAPELIRVTSVSTNAIGVVRGVGGTTAGSIAVSSALRILGSAAAENDTPPNAKSTTMATKTSYTQIFRTALSLSKTQAAAQLYGSPQGERRREQKKKLIEHKQKLNAQALFGTASESLTGGSNGGPVRTTMGLNSVVSTNVIDGGGVLTKKTFEQFSRAAFRFGSTQKLLLASPLIISAIHDWGNSFLLVEPGEKLFGVNIQRVQTGHGVFLLARDWMLENGVSGQNGFAGNAYSIDLDSCGYIYLENNGENRDTRILENVIQDGRDGYVDEVLTEGGFWFKFEKKFAKLFDVSDYAA